MYMYILVHGGEEQTEGAYAVLDKSGNKVLFFFEEEDDAERYAMMLYADEEISLRLIEVNFPTAVKTCVENGYKYSVITPGDIVIPPKT